ncbi:MAG: LysR family transcriptional regulator, partial [Azonexus sp.]|nr:LysR family transcriptional regulator [Azonexus sp.]
MNDDKRNARPGRLSHLALAVLLAVPAYAAAEGLGIGDNFKIDGYLRQDFSWNMKNWADTKDYNDRYKLSMARTMLRVNMDWKATDNLSIVAKLRGAQEYQTSFL